VIPSFFDSIADAATAVIGVDKTGGKDS